jgi:hypothetical protein
VRVVSCQNVGNARQDIINFETSGNERTATVDAWSNCVSHTQADRDCRWRVSAKGPDIQGQVIDGVRIRGARVSSRGR